MRRKLLTSVALVGSLLALGACGSADAEPTTASTSSAGAAGASQPAPEGGQEAMPEPDLEGIPDVVATVNGEEISGKDFSGVYESQFQQMAMQAQMSGQELDQDALKEQTLDSMVGSELLVQDAAASGHKASDDDVNVLLEETVKAQQLGSVDELMAVYKERGFAEEQVRSDAKKQVLMTAAIETIDIPKPTEDELKALYDQAAMAQPPAEGGGEGGGEASGGEGAAGQTPSFEELKPQLEQQLTSQKQNEAIMKRMEELRKDADVKVTL